MMADSVDPNLRSVFECASDAIAHSTVRRPEHVQYVQSREASVEKEGGQEDVQAASSFPYLLRYCTKRSQRPSVTWGELQIREEDRSKLMKLAKIGHTLAHFAPAAAAILTGGAAGPVAAAVTKEVTSALGVHHESTPEEIDQAVAEADPSQIAKLRQIEADVQKDAQAASVKMAEIAAGDRDSARKREIALHDATRRPSSRSA